MKSYAELERQLLGMPRKGDVLVDSGSNIHFLTLDDANRYFSCHILEVFAVPVVTQPVLSAFVMAAALGLLRVRRAGGLRSDEPLEKSAHRLLRE